MAQTVDRKNTAVMAVGDDDQSIYAFRGARVENMRLFEQEFAQGNVIKLEQNYRSYGHILGAANALIRGNSNRLGKELWTDRGHGEAVRVYEAESDFTESAFVVDEIWRRLPTALRAVKSPCCIGRTHNRV